MACRVGAVTAAARVACRRKFLELTAGGAFIHVLQHYDAPGGRLKTKVFTFVVAAPGGARAPVYQLSAEEGVRASRLDHFGQGEAWAGRKALIDFV